MEWIKLSEEAELERIKELSKEHPVLIFKHSTRCSISSSALNRLERAWESEKMNNIRSYFLDLLTYRQISNKISDTFGIHHESPQALIIRNGECVYHASHMGITYADICKNLNC